MPSIDDKAAIRVRFNKKREPELNVEDLRRSGVADLERIAEADKKESPSMSTRGDDNGWLSPTEVEKAVGLHFSISEGYETLKEEAARRSAATMSILDARTLIATSSGPLKRKDLPPEKARPLDPIRNATIDAKTTSPLLLREHETAMDDAVAKTKGAINVRRGFSLDDYGGPEIVKYLFGDWRCMVASHTFTLTLKEKLASGAPLATALKETAKEVASTVVGSIKAQGVNEFMNEQSRNTQIGIRDKRATAMASYPSTPIEGRAPQPSSFGYAVTGYLGIIHDRVVKPDHAMVVLDVDQRASKDIKSAEYYIPSHVPPTQVTRFYLGFSSWFEVRLYERPPEQNEEWFAVDIAGRDMDGKPTGFTITELTHREHENRTESWKPTKQSWSTADDPKKTAAFEAAHPILAATIAEMRTQLA